MTALLVIMGLILGAACQPLGVAVAKSLLKSRGKTLEFSRFEPWIMRGVFACFGAAIVLFSGSIPTACMLFLFLVIAAIATPIDYHLRIIPNELVLSVIVVRLAFGIPALLGVAGFPEFDIAQSALGCVVCLVLFLAPSLMGKKVGAGDVKFAAAMGFSLGFLPSMYALMLMGILVLFFWFYQRQIVFADYIKQMVPMAPFLCAAMLVVMILEAGPFAII